MKRRNTLEQREHDRADALLDEWAGGIEAALGYGYPAAPTAKGVQNARAEATAPERYAHDQHRHERLDRAMRRVRECLPCGWGCLWQQYVRRMTSEAMMADEHGVSVRTWRRWRDAARIAFVREYDGVHVGG